jgi:hypothetical protein
MTFEEIALDTADHKPVKWLRYVDEIFVVWSHGPAKLQQFLHHLNSIRPAKKFTMKVAGNITHPFLEVLVTKRGPNLATKVYRKAIRTGRYHHFKSTPHIT